jgi:hypothetical protein
MKTAQAVILFLSLFFAINSYGQVRTTDKNNIAWFSTIVTPRITKKLSGHIEYQFRRVNWVSDWQQSLLRAGLNYKFHPQATGHIGYGWILTFPYGANTIASVPKTFQEHRIYEQLVVNSAVGKVALTHRLRLEQRWIGKLNTIASEKPDDWVYLNRIRYMLRADVPVTKKVYVAAYDEIFIGFGKNVGENIFDQNRISALIGYKFHSTFKLEAGFLNQSLQLGREVGGKNVIQSNSGLIVNAYVQIN